MHLRGKDFQYTIQTRRARNPLSVPAYDFGWQTYYVRRRPDALPSRTRIDCLAHFDNSESNHTTPIPRNRPAGASRPSRR
jgi:hypothetical protein